MGKWKLYDLYGYLGALLSTILILLYPFVVWYFQWVNIFTAFLYLPYVAGVIFSNIPLSNFAYKQIFKG